MKFIMMIFAMMFILPATVAACETVDNQTKISAVQHNIDRRKMRG